jgi:hypothetical protein
MRVIEKVPTTHQGTALCAIPQLSMIQLHIFDAFRAQIIWTLVAVGFGNGGLLMGMSAVMFAVVLPVSICFMILAMHFSPPD